MDSIDGVSEFGVVTWMRAGVVAAQYTHGPKLRLCDRAVCDDCCVVWRMTMSARICRICAKPVAAFTGVGEPIGTPTTMMWERRVRPDLQTGEPRLHLHEFETCSAKCKNAILAHLGQHPMISKNDFIDAVSQGSGQGSGQGCPAHPQGPQDCKPSTLNFHVLPLV